MSFVGGLLGVNGGVNGTGINGPQNTNILNPTTTAQANTAYTGNQNALTQQQNFLNAVQAQNGLANQTQNYNQLQGVINGTGPNPAQAMLNQATGANTANTAALMAGQRGSSANTGLIARQAAQQGAANQQAAVGQGATMQAQQSLNAMSQAGQMANTQAAQQAQATNANTTAQQGEQQNLLNSIAQQNNANVNMQSNINSNNTQLANTSMQGQQALFGGAAQGLASGVKLFLADGGAVKAANGFPTPNTQNSPMSFIGKHIQSQNPNQLATPSTMNYGNPGANEIYKGMSSLGDMFSPSTKQPMTVSGGAADTIKGGGTVPGADITSMDSPTMNAAKGGQIRMASGGKVPALVSPGEIYLNPNDVKEVAKGKKSPLQGEKIKGTPKVKGAVNSYANDTVPKTLDEGGIVLPRSVTQSKNPQWAAHAFVSQIMAQKHRRGKNG